jgi:hypothetical protein
MNEHEKQLREFIKDIPFDMPHEAHRDTLKTQLLNAFPRHRLQPTARPAGIWRTIMTSKVSKMAVAAAVVVAALFALQLFTGTSGVVWADIAQRLGTIKTVAFGVTADIKGLPATPEGYVTHTEETVRLSYDQGVRIDSSLQTPKGPRKTHTYVLFAEGEIITVLPRQKKYLKVAIGPEQMQAIGQQKGDPVTILKAMLEHDYRELGRKTINGVPAWGIEVSDPKLGAKMGGIMSAGMFDDMVVQLWVDENHELPIAITATGSSRQGPTSMTLAISDFQWDIAIDPALLEPEIPDDYELLAQAQWEKGTEGEEIVEVLRLFAEFVEGEYPPSLNTMTVAQPLGKALKEKFPEGSPKPSQELIQRLMRVDRVGMMYSTLEKEGREPAYYGDKVSPASPGAVLFRWKTSENSYRVVFGDLSTQDVDAQELAKLEETQ